MGKKKIGFNTVFEQTTLSARENEQCIGGTLNSRTQGFIHVPMMHLALWWRSTVLFLYMLTFPNCQLSVDCPKTICVCMFFGFINYFIIIIIIITSVCPYVHGRTCMAVRGKKNFQTTTQAAPSLS